MRRFRFVKYIPTMVVAAYGSGDVIGTQQGVANAILGQGEEGYITHIQVFDKANVGPELRLHLYPRQMASVGSDNAAINLPDADIDAQEYLHSIDIPASSYIALSPNTKVANVSKLVLPVSGVSGQLFMVLEARGAYTPSAVNDLRICVWYQAIGDLI